MMDELEHLKDLPVPASRPEARARAMDAALAAFDEAQKIPVPLTQGRSVPVRPISVPRNETRRFFMRMTRPNFATAASIAALMVALPVAVTVFQRADGPRRVATVSVPAPRTQAPVETGGRTESVPGLAKPDVTITEEPAKQMAQGGEAGLKGQPADTGKTGTLVDAEPVLPAAAPPGPAASGDQPAAPAVTQGMTADATQNSTARLAAKAKVGGIQSIVPAPARVQALDKAEAYMATEPLPAQPQLDNRERHPDLTDNPVRQVAAEPVSTFSIDVDTASYSFTRRMLNTGTLPQPDAVRVEELINYFPYNYPKPETRDVPFQPTATILPAPWNPAHKLVHIGIKGYALQSTERPRANLVFLMDVSGSMQPQDRLPLVKNALRLLVDQLQPDDTVGIVTYASGAGVALEPTRIADKSKIIAAIDALGAGGSTAGAEGIQDAYRMAEAHFDKTGVNRIILATDGDFNVGLSDTEALKGLIERKRQSGIFLSILGVGEDNYNDTLMQTLAQNGNGTAAYVDTLNEARKVLVEEASSTLFTIAKDVKIQVEWNPVLVSEYRLIGYETRALKREDFNNDKVDAGDIGSGHTVTAIYEITPSGAAPAADPLRYGKAADAPAKAVPTETEYGFLKLRYKLPKEEASKLITLPLTSPLERTADVMPSADVRFATAVAAYGQLLRGSPYLGSYGYDDVIALAQSAKGDDPFGYRAEFVNLVRLAKSARP
jgi:Ca-activated chloride channel homolog